MQREMRPYNVDVILFLQPLNTPGTEVAPGSDVVREDFQRQRLVHINTLWNIGAMGALCVSYRNLPHYSNLPVRVVCRKELYRSSP
jgi:hypothetical protein